MPVTATHTIRVATGRRSGFDGQQHEPADARTAVCGAEIREQRYDRPDWPRCVDCVDAAGVTVAAPAPRQELLGWSEPEKREAFGR